jgi:hypothetical protein
MIIRYRSIIPWRKFWPIENRARFITSKREISPKVQKMLSTKHQKFLQYSFVPPPTIGETSINAEKEWRGDDWKEEVEDLIKDAAWEIGKDVVGAGLISLGVWLTNPVGPEDWLFGSPLNPIDEIIGIGLIWTGRLIMWA